MWRGSEKWIEEEEMTAKRSLQNYKKVPKVAVRSSCWQIVYLSYHTQPKKFLFSKVQTHRNRDKCSNAGSSLYQTQSQEFRQIIASLQDIWSTDLFDAWRRWMSQSWPVWHLEVLCSWRGWWGISSYLRGSSSYGRIIYIWEDIETKHHPQWLCMRGTKLVERWNEIEWAFYKCLKYIQIESFDMS